MMNDEAANALLKTEEPSPSALFIIVADSEISSRHGGEPLPHRGVRPGRRGRGDERAVELGIDGIRRSRQPGSRRAPRPAVALATNRRPTSVVWLASRCLGNTPRHAFRLAEEAIGHRTAPRGVARTPGAERTQLGEDAPSRWDGGSGN
jgi:hypothetical protein